MGLTWLPGYSGRVILIIYRYLTTYILWTYTQKSEGEINIYILFI